MKLSDEARWQEIPHAIILRPDAGIPVPGVKKTAAQVEALLGIPAKGPLSPEQIRTLLEWYIENYPQVEPGRRDNFLPDTWDFLRLSCEGRVSADDYYRAMEECGYKLIVPDDEAVPFASVLRPGPVDKIPFEDIAEKAVASIEDSGKGNLTPYQVLTVLDAYVSNFPYAGKKQEHWDRINSHAWGFIDDQYRGRYNFQDFFDAMGRLGYPPSRRLVQSVNEMRMVLRNAEQGGRGMKERHTGKHDLIARWERASTKKDKEGLLGEAWMRTGHMRDLKCRVYDQQTPNYCVMVADGKGGSRRSTSAPSMSAVEAAMDAEGLYFYYRPGKGENRIPTEIRDVDNDIVYELDPVDGLHTVNLRRFSTSEVNLAGAA